MASTEAPGENRHKTMQHFKHLNLHDIKVGIIHKKHAWGKLANLVNPNHRHDEEHERETDEKRTRIAESHRFNSFAPERENNIVKWYVDGRDYFWALSVSLERAQETIMIADWWLSPELFLRRPPYYNHEWRLDRILKRKAEQGVKIYVMVYREIESVLTCNSMHTKRALQALCPEGSKGHGNIYVMRHPDHNALTKGGDMTFYWAHHEKIAIVDNTVAYVGGLDACFGRWDNRQHPLADVHPSGIPEEVWPGQDYNNNRVLDFKNVDDWEKNQLNKAENGRMPWHDVHLGIIGQAVTDVTEHYVLRWNFIKRDKYKRDDDVPWLEMPGREGADEDLVGVQRPKHPVGGYVEHPLGATSTGEQRTGGAVDAQIVRSSCDWSSGILLEHSIQTAYCQIIRAAEHYVYIENQFFITATGEEQKPIQNQIGAAIVEAVVRAAKERRKFRVMIVIPAVPGFAGDLRDPAAAGTRAIMDYQYKSICRGPHSIFERIRAAGAKPEQYIFIFNLRSFDRLNVTPGLKKEEEETGLSYQEMEHAQAQELMGEDIAGDKKGAARDHIKAQMKSREQSAKNTGDGKNEHGTDQQGSLASPRGQGENAEKGDDSIAQDAMLNTQNLSDEAFDGAGEDEVDLWIQEELYIHAKLMIADDIIAICGSSNINDRSQLGSHDSEIACVFHDTNVVESKMDGKPFQASHQVASLRRQLWREHLGLLPPQDLDGSDDPNAQPPDVPNQVDEDEWNDFVADPLSDKVWKMWTSQATTNTRVFRELFHSDPDNHINTFEDYDKFLPHKFHKPGHIYNRYTPPEDIRAKLDKIRGHLVWMPLDFLKDVDLAEKNLSMAVNSWTQSIYT